MVGWVAAKYPWGTEYSVWSKLNEKEREAVDGVDTKLKEVEKAMGEVSLAMHNVSETWSDVPFHNAISAVESFGYGKDVAGRASGQFIETRYKAETARDTLKNGTYTEYRLIGGNPEKVKKKYANLLRDAIKELDSMLVVMYEIGGMPGVRHSKGCANLITCFMESVKNKLEYVEDTETYDALTESIKKSDGFAAKVEELKDSLVSAKETFKPVEPKDHWLLEIIPGILRDMSDACRVFNAGDYKR